MRSRPRWAIAHRRPRPFLTKFILDEILKVHIKNSYLQNSGSSPSVRFSFPAKLKSRRIPDAVILLQTSKSISYGGIIRIRYKGRRCILPLSLSKQAPPAFSFVKIKTGETRCGFSCKKSLHDDFLRRHYPHQVKGRSWMTSSQPAHTSSPVFISELIIHARCPEFKIHFKNNSSYHPWITPSTAKIPCQNKGPPVRAIPLR